MKELQLVQRSVVACRRCPRLVAHRERVAADKTKRFADEVYWGRPVPSFGDARARLLVVGLAPAAHGANRTGRMFTGDRSGDFLFSALHDAGFANRGASIGPRDGLRLSGAYITAVVRCAPPANKPTRPELASCREFLTREIQALQNLAVVLALGRIAFDGFLSGWAALGHELPVPKPRFAHGEEVALGSGVTLVSSYHPSQQNTFTGRLTSAMFARVLARARSLAGTGGLR